MSAAPEALAAAPAGRRRLLVLHPIFFAAFPVLFLYAQNIQEAIPVGDLLKALVVVVGASALLFGLLRLVLGDSRRAGLIVSSVVLLFFSYGHVSRSVERLTVGGVRIGRNAVLLPLWVILAAVAVALAVRFGSRSIELTRGLNVVAIGLVLLNVITIVRFDMASRSAERAIVKAADSGFAGRLPSPGTLAPSPTMPKNPDIYYVILEEYGGERTLRDQFGFDNAPFLDALTKAGFQVTPESTANYPRTSLSVASSLNMQYLDFLTAQMGTDSKDTTPLSRMMQYNRVGRFLKSIGYRYYQIGSWWGPTATSPLARNITFGGLSEFESVLERTTILQPLAGDDFRRREWKRIQFQFAALESAPELPGPKFVFAHLLVPHDPYVFDRQGHYVTQEEAGRHTQEYDYVQQVEYANRRVEGVLAKLLDAPPDRQPVIVIQADEGPYQGAPTIWTAEPRADVLARKFEILNAYHLPGPRPTGVYPTITPVNTFRLIFDRYFAAKLDLLPDRNVVFRSLRHLYDFTDVTDQVRALLPAGTG